MGRISCKRLELRGGLQVSFGTRSGEVAERPNALVLKTSDPRGSQGSNPCLSAIYIYKIIYFKNPCGGNPGSLFDTPQ